jgi:hypothetical protein
MADDWKKTASLVFDTLSDTVELVMLIVIPTPATSVNGKDKMRALHLSALIAITILGIWLVKATSAAGSTNFEALFFIVLSIVFFTLVSWIIFGLLKLTGLYDPKGETITDALTLVIGFNLFATAAAVVIKEADILFRSNLEDYQLRTVVFLGALASAILFVSIRIIIKLPERSMFHLMKAASIVMALGVFTALYLNFLLPRY